jgi:hypothetical protein
MDIEVVTIQKTGTGRKILRRAFSVGPMVLNINHARKATSNSRRSHFEH